MENLIMTVADGLSVVVIPSTDHEFLMTTKDVALGYDINESSLRSHLHRYKDDIIENKHFIKGVAICNTLDKKASIQPHQIFWTKAGVVRLAMFIKSERAKLFRDWVEQLVLNYIEKKLPTLPSAPKNKHNRLTQDRLLDIMNDVCRIEDTELRMAIANKLLGKG